MAWALLRITQVSEVGFVELEIAASSLGEGLHGAVVGIAEIAIKLVQVRIHRFADGFSSASKVEHAGRGDCHLGRGPFGALAQEAEMADHGVAAEAKLADHPHTLGLGGSPFERDALLRGERLATLQALQEIEVPHGASKLTVRDAAQTDLCLFGDYRFDSAVFDGPQFFRADLAASMASARLL